MKKYFFSFSGRIIEVKAVGFHTAMQRCGRYLQRENKKFFNLPGIKKYRIILERIEKMEKEKNLSEGIGLKTPAEAEVKAEFVECSTAKEE